MGKKLGMTQLFDETGHLIVCTVIEVEPNVITQIKSTKSDGYNAVQTGYKKVVAKDPRRKESRVKKPIRGKFAKVGVEPRRHLVETKVNSTDGFEIGQEFGVSQYNEISFIDAIATSKGKGYQGVMKRHGFKGGNATHGSGFHRGAGSTGGLTPGRSLRNEKRPGQMGNERVTVQNLKIVQLDEDAGLMIVKGAIPGPKNSLVTLQPAVKKNV